MTPLDKRHLDTLRHLDAGGGVPADEMIAAVLHFVAATSRPPDATTLDVSDSPDTLVRAAPPGVAP